MKEEILNILEYAWIKGRTDGSLGTKYDTSPDTMYRLRRDMEQFKDVISAYLTSTPRSKRFYIEELDQSDYEKVNDYIKRARRDGLKHYKENLRLAKKVWTSFKYKDPESWDADQVTEYLSTCTKVSKSRVLDAIRQVAPHLKEQVKTGRYREMIGRRKKDIFGKEVNMIRTTLKKRYSFGCLVWSFHISGAFREGHVDSSSGIVGISWDKFKRDFSTVDDYESKVRAGITWRDCPVDIFFKNLPNEIKKEWIKRGRPTQGKFLEGGYQELLNVYKRIREELKKEYEGKIDPSLLNEFITLRPHDSDKIHVNLLWEAGVPLEVVAGQFLGHGEGLGLMGRGWLDINVIKKHYLSLTQRSERFQKIREEVRTYAKQFNGGEEA